jgi:hypothetical protein
MKKIIFILLLAVSVSVRSQQVNLEHITTDNVNHNAITGQISLFNNFGGYIGYSNKKTLPIGVYLNIPIDKTFLLTYRVGLITSNGLNTSLMGGYNGSWFTLQGGITGTEVNRNFTSGIILNFGVKLKKDGKTKRN